MKLSWIVSSIMIILYACSVMYLLLDVKWERLSPKRQIVGASYFIIFIILNIGAQITLGHGLYGKFYLLLTQLPVFILFFIISEYKGIKLFFVLLTAVFFSAPVMTTVTIVKRFVGPQIWMFLICYIIMVFIIYKFFKEPFNYMLEFAENSVFLFFSTIPLVYYIYSYSLTHYQLANLVVDKQYVIYNLPMVIVLIAYLLLTKMFKMVSEKADIKNREVLAAAQLGAATKEIEQLKMADKQLAIYRHDLRHHMNYINACIAENKLEEAKTYIDQTCEGINQLTVKRYSENEHVNLILASYADKARRQGINVKINVTATDFSRFNITDICSLFANCLENAIRAAVVPEDDSLRYVKLRIYEKNNHLCLSLSNGYSEEPVFKNGAPISKKKGHGIGIRSIIYVVKKYGGIYDFSANEGEFSFKMTM